LIKLVFSYQNTFDDSVFETIQDFVKSNMTLNDPMTIEEDFSFVVDGRGIVVPENIKDTLVGEYFLGQYAL
jgi:hypothetical protein